MDNVFKTMIEPSLDGIPVLNILHSEWHDGVKFRVTQTVSRNVFNEFDRKLSDHLAGTRGTGFPAYRVTVDINDLRSKAAPKRIESSYHSSVPHALMRAAERAFARTGPVELMLQRGDSNPGQILPICQRRKVDASYITLLNGALGLCRHIGATAFLDVAGEFDEMTITPPGGLDPIVLRLQSGTVLVPSTLDSNKPPFEWPIFAFAEHSATNVAAQNYLARVRQAVVTRKEEAVLAFRAAAEGRILDFDRALAGRALEGHWLDGAIGLIVRLEAGLGADLSGLSEAARGKALDWRAAIAAARARRPAPVASASPSAVAPNRRKRRNKSDTAAAVHAAA